jgi:hypothetical protein
MSEDNITNYSLPTAQTIYDDFNNFIFSTDRKIVGKLFHKLLYFEKTKHLPGDIVEIGVFKGSGIASWLKILDIFCSQTNKKVIGFDFFSVDSTIDYLKEKQTSKSLKAVVERTEKENLTVENVKKRIKDAGFDESKYILVKGNINDTTKEFVNKNPGFRISILYLDADIDEPSYYSLLYLWDRIVPGGYIVFDEYEFHTFDESNGVDRFLKEKNIEYTIQTTNFINPSAFMIKKHF